MLHELFISADHLGVNITGRMDPWEMILVLFSPFNSSDTYLVNASLAPLHINDLAKTDKLTDHLGELMCFYGGG